MSIRTSTSCLKQREDNYDYRSTRNISQVAPTPLFAGSPSRTDSKFKQHGHGYNHAVSQNSARSGSQRESFEDGKFLFLWAASQSWIHSGCSNRAWIRYSTITCTFNRNDQCFPAYTRQHVRPAILLEAMLSDSIHFQGTWQKFRTRQTTRLHGGHVLRNRPATT